MVKHLKSSTGSQSLCNRSCESGLCLTHFGNRSHLHPYHWWECHCYGILTVGRAFTGCNRARSPNCRQVERETSHVNGRHSVTPRPHPLRENMKCPLFTETAKSSHSYLCIAAQLLEACQRGIGVQFLTNQQPSIPHLAVWRSTAWTLIQSASQRRRGISPIKDTLENTFCSIQAISPIEILPECSAGHNASSPKLKNSPSAPILDITSAA